MNWDRGEERFFWGNRNVEAHLCIRNPLISLRRKPTVEGEGRTKGGKDEMGIRCLSRQEELLQPVCPFYFGLFDGSRGVVGWDILLVVP